jgi:uncharacterized protein (DUF1330 family)
MTAYLIFIREAPVQDGEAMEEYQRLAAPTIEGVDVKFRVLFGKMEVFEGRTPDGIVMLEFPSAEEARAWYKSPGYQAATAFRTKAADYRAILVEGFNSPEPLS